MTGRSMLNAIIYSLNTNKILDFFPKLLSPKSTTVKLRETKLKKNKAGQMPKSSKKTYESSRCRFCRRLCISPSEARRHEEDVHKKRCFLCKTCGLVFRGRQGKSAHKVRTNQKHSDFVIFYDLNRREEDSSPVSRPAVCCPEFASFDDND